MGKKSVMGCFTLITPSPSPKALILATNQPNVGLISFIRKSLLRVDLRL